MIRQASSRLSVEAQAIMDGQTAVKQVVKDLYLRGYLWFTIETAVRKVIKQTQSEIANDTLKADTEKSYIALAWRIYNELKNSPVFADLALLRAVIGIKSGNLPTAQKEAAERLIERHTWQMPKGTQMQQRIYHYWKDVKATVERLANERALDEDDSSQSKISLRAKAEIIVREEFHGREMEEMRRKTRLVIVTTHADCSDRCAPYQGRVYSLDGTSGTTSDGRKYVPIEEATQNPRDRYVTKAGVVYQNGLFGFNCRHHMIEYADGLTPPTESEAKRKAEVAIDKRQRQYEREIIRAREKAIAYKGIDRKEYTKWKIRASKLFEDYAEYSHAHGRSYYTSRIRVL